LAFLVTDVRETLRRARPEAARHPFVSERCAARGGPRSPSAVSC